MGAAAGPGVELVPGGVVLGQERERGPGLGQWLEAWLAGVWVGVQSVGCTLVPGPGPVRGGQGVH